MSLFFSLLSESRLNIILDSRERPIFRVYFWPFERRFTLCRNKLLPDDFHLLIYSLLSRNMDIPGITLSYSKAFKDMASPWLFKLYCRFLYPNYFFPSWIRIVLMNWIWETSRNKLKNHSVWMNCSSDWEKLLKFEAEDQEFTFFSRSLEQSFLTRSEQFSKQNTITFYTLNWPVFFMIKNVRSTFIFESNFAFLSKAVEVKLDKENIAGDVWKMVKEIPSFPWFPIPILDPNSVFTVDQTQ